MNILDIDLDKINKDREIGIKCKDFNLLLKCAVDMAEAFTYSRLLAEEAAFFLGRIGDRTRFESVIYGPTLKLPPSLREPRSFQMEEKLYELGQKYPFLDDEELDFLETLYCKSNTFDMVNRMLFDGDDLLRRKLARFNQDDFNIRHDVFSCEFCLEIFDALIKNENELNVQEALDARHQSFDDMKEEARLYGFSPKLKYDPILVYNRRTNTIQVDETDLSDRFLCPISNFSWTGLKLGDAVNLLINEFNHSVEESIIVPALEKCRITKQAITYAAFNTYWYLIVENAIIRNLGISSSDERLLKVRERIAYDWLTYQNKKELR